MPLPLRPRLTETRLQQLGVEIDLSTGKCHGDGASFFRQLGLLLEFCLIDPGNVALVLTLLAGWPAFSRLNASAIEKQPASAAPMSSSGLVPFPSSKRDENE